MKTIEPVKSVGKVPFRERFNISRFALRYSRLTIAFWIGVMVVGMFAFTSFKYALFPDITYPVVVVTAQAPLETALATEAQLTKPIEAKLQSLSKTIETEDINSWSYPGQSITNILFTPGITLEEATQATQKKLAQVSLPSGSKVEVIPYNLNESSVITYAIKSEKKSLSELTQLAQETLIPQIRQLPGVLKVNLLGNAGSELPQPQEETSSINPNSPTLVRFNSQDALAFQVIKQGKANTLDVVSEVEKTVQKLQAQLPEVQLTLAESQAAYIREAIQVTIDELIGAVVLAIIAIFAFLRTFSGTLIPTLTLPTSLLATFIVMKLCHYNLETITLLALALVIGMVVDDSIVDVENIMRLLDSGKPPKRAVIQGTNEIGLAMIVSNLTIVAVFLPVGLMGGGVGRFFNPFGVTISAAVIFSLLVARTLSPVLAVSWLKPSQSGKQPGNFRRRKKFQQWITDHYGKLLSWSLEHRYIVVGIAIASFIAGIALIPLIPKGFVPSLDRGEFNIVYTTPLPKLSGLFQPKESANQTTTDSSGAFAWIGDLAQSPERLLLKRAYRVGKQLETAALTVPEVESTFTIVGARGEFNRGKIYVRLKGDRQLTTAEAQEKMREALPKIKGVSLSVEDVPFVQTEAEKPLQMAIRGENLSQLRETAQKIQAQVKQLPGLVDVDISGEKNEADNLIEIERVNGERAIFLSANLLSGKGVEDAALEVEKIAQPLLPPGFNLQRWGSAEQSSDLLQKFALTMVIAIILMLSLLVLFFGRLLEPIVLGLSLPLAVVGAMLGLLVTQSELGVSSLIGLILLVGLLGKNGILLLDYANQLREVGRNRKEAIIQSGKVRLRPIFMTTAATILGVIPVALGLGAGAELRQPMAMVIIGGLMTSTLLSLIVVPVLYTLLEDLSVKLFGTAGNRN